jgi:hypothetical protein
MSSLAGTNVLCVSCCHCCVELCRILHACTHCSGKIRYLEFLAAALGVMDDTWLSEDRLKDAFQVFHLMHTYYNIWCNCVLRCDIVLCHIKCSVQRCGGAARGITVIACAVLQRQMPCSAIR